MSGLDGLGWPNPEDEPKNSREREALGPSDATTLLADLARLKREIFALRNHPASTEKAQAHMDTAREYLRAAIVDVEFHSANDLAQTLPPSTPQDS